MQIQLNGETITVTDAITVHALVLQCQLGGKRIAVEVNEEIVPRSAHGTTTLREGDNVEIVHAIGGG